MEVGAIKTGCCYGANTTWRWEPLKQGVAMVQTPHGGGSSMWWYMHVHTHIHVQGYNTTIDNYRYQNKSNFNIYFELLQNMLHFDTICQQILLNVALFLDLNICGL